MKNDILQYIFLCINLLLTFCTTPKTNHETASTNTFFKINSMYENKGAYVTSLGELRTLIVYAAFSDDDKTKSEAWKFSKTDLPSWANKLLNKDTRIDFPHDNLTQYFYEMSGGKLFLYGDIYPKLIVPKYKQSNYKSIAEVNSEILAQIDGEIDFSKYDNWSVGNDKKYINKPDGKVDVIFIVYRNFENRLFFNNGWTGAAHLYLSNDYRTNDGVKISTGRLNKGSGIQSRGGKAGYNYIKYVLAHEFGHLLFGAGHIENTTNLALMTGGPVWNASRGMHSWERVRLGWMKYIDIPNDRNTSILLEDYHSTKQAYRIKLSEKEWYVLENHQNVSKHDWAKDKGVYIYHVKYANLFAPHIEVKCADGNWDFIFDKGKMKLFRTIPNSKGKSEMNVKKYIGRKTYSCYKAVYGNNDAWGDKYDAFDEKYNNLISPVSNPSSRNNSEKEFAILIKEKYDTRYKVDFIFKNIYENTPPSKPQILNLDFHVGKLNLIWLKNEEPDLAGYFIYKEQNNKVTRKFISKEKTEFNIIKNLNKKSENTFWLTSVDTNGNESVRSNFSVIRKSKSWTLKRYD